ncbi:MAG TPA: PHP domain-containing protein [Gemmatimonadales bacterium]|jgi:DNA polymerase (family 10)|nr:PHP domain-containing protein [Gemmatimonadales bacterium]
MPRLSNAEIAKVLLGLAQLLSVQKENPFKIRAYRRAAKAIVNLPESIDELVRSDSDLTAIPGIGKSISGAIREIVQRGGALQQLEDLRLKVGQHSAALSEYPLLDPGRVERIYRKLQISSLAELKERLERGDIGQQMGARMEQHVREALVPRIGSLLYEADHIVPAIEEFLRRKCDVRRVEVAGDFRRRVEVIRELSFLIQAQNFQNVVDAFARYGGRTTLITADATTAVFEIPSEVRVRLANTTEELWGLSLLIATGSEHHLEKLFELGHDLTALTNAKASCRTEKAVYRTLGLQLIPAELREGYDEVERAAARRLPDLITTTDICGDLHAHTISSDGAHTIDQMAAAAQKKGYKYLGITDHSQSLAIARGISESDLWAQLRYIDELNERTTSGIRILKSAEVDILVDGSLDYPDAVLKELDYTVCSIHSRFGLGKTAQTERIMRAMDNRYFNILGHATGRRLLKRPGYDLDLERVVEHARQTGCFFEINSSPERLDLSATNARFALQAGVKIAINTDAHSTREFDFIACGVEQGRRAGLDKGSVLNCLPWAKLQRTLRR